MARINLDLSKFKSSGIYTLEFDQSESITLSSQTIRLVVGFSRIGPFNAPVYLDDIKKAKKIFGDIDPLLEKRGSFFHRSMFTCLKNGPIFALNLMPLNNGQDLSSPVDKVDWKSFSINVAETNGNTYQSLYSAFYNKQRFWTPDTEAFQAIQDTNAVNKDKFLSFTNLSQNPISIIVRKTNPKGFNITANEWFKGNPPEWIKPFDYISDYFVEVIVVKGNWTNYEKLSIDPIFSKYFDVNGIKKSELNNFLTNSSVNQIANFVGSIIPNLIDGENRNHFLENVINNNLLSTGLMVNINQEKIEDYANSVSKIDLVGHGLVNNILSSSQSALDFLSYSMPIKKDYLYSQKTAFTTTSFTSTDFPSVSLESFYMGGENGIFENVLVIEKSSANATKYAQLRDSLVENKSFIQGKDGITTVNLVVRSILETSTQLRISYSNPTKLNEPSKINGVALTAFTLPSTLGGNGTFTIPGDYNTAGPLALSAGDIILIQKSGWRQYYKVVSTSLSSGNTIITVDGSSYPDFSGIDTVNCKLYSGTRAKVALPVSSNPLIFTFNPDTFTLASNEYTAYPGSQIYKDIENGIIKNGDKINNTSAVSQYLYFIKTIDISNMSIYKIRSYTTSTFATQATIYAFGATYTSNAAAVLSTEFNVISANNALNSSYSILSSNGARTEVTVSNDVGKSIKIGDYLVAENLNTPGTYSLTKIIDSRKFYNNVSNDFQFLVKTNERIWISSNTIMKFSPIDDIATNYKLSSLGGFTLTDFHLPGDSMNESSQLAKILGVLDPSQSNIMNTLASKDVISFRYIVDTFDGGLSSGSYPKNILTTLAKKRQKCLALINAPSMKKFIKSNDPLFTDVPDYTTGNLQPTLNTKYIVDGANLTLGPSFRYTLPDEDNGSKFAGFFSPFLVVRDSGKNILVPPAAYVSNLFIKKFQNGIPYSIIAGTRRGIISDPEVIGLEYDFLDEDRDNLEPFGINPIIYRKGKGIMVYGNQSGYQRTLSALNSLHVRDLLITIEESIEDILSNYVFEFNDSSTRLQIKSIVESYLSNVQSDGGIYTFTVAMDESNNTPDIIDQNVGIIDISIEPVKGLQRVFNRITVNRTGGSSSGGFSAS